MFVTDMIVARTAVRPHTSKIRITSRQLFGSKSIEAVARQQHHIATMEPSPYAQYCVYSRLWLVTEALSLWHDPFVAPHQAWIYVLCVLLTAACWKPSKELLSLVVLVRMAMYFVQAPAIWDSCVWANFTDSIFAVALLYCPSLDLVVPMCANLVRTQMGIFYIGAGFWKLNSAFLSPRASCAPIYFASLLSFLPEVLTPSWLVRPALVSAPLLTVIGEMSVGVGLLLPSSLARRTGLVLAMALHYAIGLTPHPNQVPNFGVFCAARLFFTMPEAWTLSIQEAFSLPSLKDAPRSTAIRVGALVLIAASAPMTSVPGFFIDWAIPLQTALCILGARAVAFDIQLAKPPSRLSWPSDVLAKSTGAGTGTGPARRLAGARLLDVGASVVLALTLAYAFAFQALGLMDVSAVAPFSSIREHGGSNHLLMATSLLQRVKWRQGSALDDAFGGGVVRVVHTTSDYLNALYPGNCTFELRPRIVDILRDGGHIAQQYNPTVNIMLGHEIRKHIPHWTPQSGTPFPKYTVPGHELRRLLGEVRAQKESFALEYEHLPGLLGDEHWRKTAVASRVHLKEDGEGRRTCRMQSAHDLPWMWQPCAENELAMQPAPAGPLSKLMAFFPYPIIEGLDVLPCID